MVEIIVFEGLDKSGKHTQSNLLVDWLKAKGYTVEKSEFHRYDTPTGELIRKWLYGKWDIDQETIELIMAADKQAQQSWIRGLEERGVDFLVLDRYTTSQLVYAQANSVDIHWVEGLQSNLIKPDFEIFIDITPQESMVRKGQHGENDRYESNHRLLTNVRELYLDYYKDLTNVFILHEADKLNVDEVFNKIKTAIKSRYS